MSRQVNGHGLKATLQNPGLKDQEQTGGNSTTFMFCHRIVTNLWLKLVGPPI